jgi:predicted metal-dependent hydrolase
LMVSQIQLGDLGVEVVRKHIKNVHLSVHPPSGRVRISAPEHMKLDTIRVFAIAKLGWIKQQQKKLRGQERETPREYLDRESHYVWGKRYLLKIVEEDAPPRIELKHNNLVLQIRPRSNKKTREAVLYKWYRQQAKEAIPAIIKKWQPLVGVEVADFFVQRMKTKWGSCNSTRATIRLNSELAKKPPACLEYIVVHEMVHLLERSHNRRFVTLINQFMPRWQFYRDELNRLPVRHERWGY